jgi:Zn-dependent M28 family amino/carboxypeptidase
MSEKGQVGHNVVGLYHGGYADCDSYIIVGAHFDHIGNLGGKLYPGADANASGTVAMTSIARMMGAMRIATGRRLPSNVIFVGFDGKESDMAGSIALWNMISNGELTDPVSGKAITPRQIKLMVNIDQIGATLSPLRKDRPDYIIMLGNDRLKQSKRGLLEYCNKNLKTNLDLGFDYYGSEQFTTIFYRLSDQRVFIDHGIPSVLFTSGITMKTNKTYDNVASLDYAVFRRRVLLMFYWIEKML